MKYDNTNFNSVNFDGIKINGSKKFITNTIRSLELIKKAQGDYDYFEFVKSCIGIIKEHTESGMVVYSNPPVFQVGYRTYTASATWYASCIVHDANHSLQYKLKKPYYGKTAEEECMRVQIEFLKSINGPMHEIKHLQYLIDNEVDYYSPSIKRTW